MGKLYVAKQDFVSEIGGERTFVIKGKTRVDEAHPLYRGTPAAWWEEAGETVTVESATKAPGETRPRAPRKAAAKEG